MNPRPELLWTTKNHLPILFSNNSPHGTHYLCTLEKAKPPLNFHNVSFASDKPEPFAIFCVLV